MRDTDIKPRGLDWSEKALRESEEKYRRLAEHSPDMIYRMSLPEGRYEYVSPAATQITGYTPEDHYSYPCLAIKIIHPGWKQFLKEKWALLKKGEVEPFFEYQIVDKSGNARWIHQRNMLIRDEFGHPVALEAIATDITERKQGEIALQESERRLRRFCEAGLFGVIFWNIDGTITEANDKFLEIVGYSRKDLHDGVINGFNLTPQEYADVDMQSVKELMEYGVNKTIFEKEYIRKDGTRVPVILAGAFLDNKKTRGEAFVIDISARKKAETSLRKSNRQLNLLTSITRHDIMNKISAILGYLSLAEMEVENPVVRDYLQNIGSATRIIRSHIAFTKVYENLGTHEPQWQSLDIITAQSPLLPPGMKIQSQVKNIEVYADPMLERVFFNLLENAIRHGEHADEIRVSAKINEENLLITWEDNGIGIPASEKEKIFERGYGKNSGLGLFLAREILALTDITITETGQPGKGARFEITIPREDYRINP